MINLTFEEIQHAVSGRSLLKREGYEFSSLSTDSRNIEVNSIFVALKGDKFNGNNFIEDASARGASLCIIDEINFKEEKLKENTSVIVVDDCRRALLHLAKYYRSKLKIKVIGVTGSTGKTSTKDLIAAALGSKFKVFKTKGNFNNEIGLPLMIFKLDDSYDIAVLEMGMSNFNEIHNLADVARPDIAVITNIGVSHIENLKTRENILKAKMEITDFFKKENILIVNIDNDLLKNITSEKYSILKTGTENDADLWAKDISLSDTGISFKVMDKEGIESPSFEIDVPGRHNVLNSMLAIACGKVLGVSNTQMALGLKQLEVTSMRLDIVKGKMFTILDDCYNASPDSMRAALEVLGNLNCSRKIAVLGTMKELGDTAYELHKDIGSFAKSKKIDYLLVFGEYSEAFKDGFKGEENFMSFDNYDDLVDFLQKNLKAMDGVLVKASRSMKFEYIVNKLKIMNN